MKKLLFFVCAIFAFVACTQIVIEEQQGIAIEASETLTVGFEDGDQTRIQLNEAQKTVWNKEDLASVFYRSDANQKWQYQGETGERVGDLKRVEDAVGTTKTTKTVVVYPYSENYWLNTDSYAIEATLPATQYYAEGSYGVGSNLMVSQSEFTQFSLKSVCGWLKLQLTGNGEVVKSIKFRGNNEEQVAGLIYVDTATAEATLASEMGGTDDNNAGGNLVFDDTIFTELTLDCGEGVTLGEEVTTFYLSLPPQTFANGFTIDIESEGYEILTLSTTNELVIERNTIQPMAAVAVECIPEPQGSEILYTTSDGEVCYTSAAAYDANIISNIYENGIGIIKFDGPITKIGESAFDGKYKLESIIIPEGVTVIGLQAFRSCTSLKEIELPQSLTTIEEKAFIRCAFESINIPNTVTYIGPQAFDSCNKLSSIIVPDNVTTIGRLAFWGCENIESITLGKSISEISEQLCSYCHKLTHVSIPESVTTISREAFYDCSSITSITIPDGVTSIGEYTFKNCSSLISVTLPSSITKIGREAFRYCSNLSSVYCKALTPPTGDSYMFDGNASGRKIYVQIEKKDIYKTKSYWSDYADAIVGTIFSANE